MSKAKLPVLYPLVLFISQASLEYLLALSKIVAEIFYRLTGTIKFLEQTFLQPHRFVFFLTEQGISYIFSSVEFTVFT